MGGGGCGLQGGGSGKTVSCGVGRKERDSSDSAMDRELEGGDVQAE